jgi:hypothetical protein
MTCTVTCAGFIGVSAVGDAVHNRHLLLPQTVSPFACKITKFEELKVSVCETDFSKSYGVGSESDLILKKPITDLYLIINI